MKKNTLIRRKKPVVEEIEPRILYSADFSPGVLDPHAVLPQAEQRVLDASGEFAASAAQTQVSAPQSVRHEVVFVDTAVPDYQKLVQDITANGNAQHTYDVVLLNSGADGIKQISQTLAGMHDVSAVHIISHGADGQMQLGDTTLNFDSLLKNASQIKSWGQALTADADVLIYGCDVAEHADGKALVDALSRLTGADVAASENLTGAAAKGGDWTLEYSTGYVDTALAISAQAQLDYSATLATFTVTNANDTGAGSLRAAITSANGAAGADTINFNIAGAGVHTINLASALPNITDAVTINGTTQPGFAGTPLIELNGTAAGGATSGLILGAGSSGSTIRGLVIDRFAGSAIRILGSSNNIVAGNFLGTNAAGTAGLGNQVGIFINSSSANNTIGGTTAADRNLISSNTVDGVQIIGAGTQGNVVEGNYIGLDVTGTVDLGNTNQGVAIFGGASNNTIGGTAAGAGNVISGNGNVGVQIDDAAETGNAIWGNSIYGNGSLGIDLNKNGVTANDAGDADTGANNLQNYPVLTSAVTTGAQVTITGSLNSTPSRSFRIEFFSSVTADASGHGEAERYLGFVNVTTPGSGNIAINATLTSTVAVGEAITATATNLTTNDTSEFSLNVLASNTAPVLSGANNFTAVNEDPAANPGTLVSALIAGKVSDADSGALFGIAVTAVVNTNGTWQYSTNGGGSWNAFGAPSGANARLLAADANTYVRFVPNANWNGTVASGITFRAWDQTSGAAGSTANTSPNGGSTAYSTATASASITVNSVNDAPVGTNKTVTTNEDTAYTFATADFGFTDPSDSPANALTAVKISTIPAAGSLTLSGVGVSVGQTVSVANITAGNLKFTPAANANGAGYASFTFQVQDNGGTANGGVDLDVTPRTMTVNVTAVNDAPVGTNKTVTTNEDTAYTFATADFGFTDPSDSPANALTAVKISTIPAAGSLTLSGVGVSVGQTVSVANITAGNLKFTPAANANGAGYASFTFQVQDNGGTANGGVDLDVTPRTMTVNVTAVNDAPVGTNKTVTTNEDTAYTFATADFGFTDPSDSPANALTAVKISTIPAAGSLTLSGVGVSVGQTVSVANITAGNLKFTPAANANGAGYASFTFQVQDNGGTANGGVDLDVTPRTMTVNVTAVNDAPVGTNKTVTTNEDTAYTFATADFGFTDPSDSPANALTAVKISTIPAAGSLTLSGVGVSVGQTVSVANITAGNLKFTPAANANGAGYASFTFQVQDNGGTANGGVDLDVTPRTMTVNVTAVNDAPVGTNKTVTTNEDTAYTFATADFGFTDPSDSPANALTAVKISTIPAAGSLTLSGVGVSVGQTVSVANITAGNLKFTPAANANGAGYASFTFQVQDNGGTANGGVDLDVTPRTMTVNVTAVNDAPINTVPAAQGTSQDTALVFSSANGNQISIADLDAASASLQITLTATNGLITLNGVGGLAFTTGDGVADASMTFTGTLANINVALNGLSFNPTSGFSGAASLSIVTNDQGNTGTGGAKSDSDTVNIAVNAAAAPTATNDAYSVNEDSTVTVSNTWYDANWQYREQLSFNNATRAENLVNFPVLVAIDTANFGASFYSQAQAAGQDLRFVDANGTLLTHEIESWNPGGTSYVWVKVPQIDASSNGDSISMYWGNASAADIQNGAAVWSNSYAGEWHFNGNVTDSTGLNTATDNGTTALVGQVAAGRSFNGTGAYVQTSSTTLQTADSFTIGTWFNADATDYTHHLLWEGMNGANGFGDPGTPAANQEMNLSMGGIPALNTPTDNYLTFFLGDQDEAADPGVLQISTPFTDTAGWHYVSVVVNNMSTAPAATMYLDGVAVGSDTGTLARTSRTDWDTAMRFGEPGVATRYYDGALDELNLATVARSANWVDAQYASMTGTLISNAAAQARPAMLGVLANDADPLGLPLTAVLVSGPSNAAAFALNADGTFSYTPVANYNGADTFTYRANDGTSNSNTATVTITVNAVNDAPVGTNKTVTTNEDTAYTFGAADFGFTDPSDSPANALTAVKISTIPAAGSLTLSGVGVSVGQTVSVANITAGNLKFTPAANANGAGYASFTFQVQDDGGTANGGVDLDPVANTMAIDVTAVNDSPTGANKTVNTNENTAYTFATVDFGFTDPSDTPADALLNVKITTLPGAGTLTDNGVAVSSGQFVTAADISGGLLVFTPAANANGAGYASFTFQVQDDGGTANSGVDLDPTPNTITIDVTAINDAPVLSGANNLTAINEDPAANPGTLVSTLISGQTSDIDPAALTGIAVTAVDNANGAWQYSINGGTTWNNFGAPTGAAARLLAADASTYVRFLPNANWNGSVATGITFRAWDQSSGAAGATANTTVNGGTTAFSSATASSSITVNPVNDAPAGANNTVTTSEDTAYSFTVADFGFIDPADTPADALLNVQISTLPGAGTLTDNGVAVSAGQSVTLADIAAGNLTFTPALNANGAGYTSFSFQVQDDGGTANGGVDLDPTPRTMTVDVTPVNDAPTAADGTVTTAEDIPYVFNVGDFNFSDVDGDTLQSVTVVSLSGGGSLTLFGAAVGAGQVISAVNIGGGNLVFTPAAATSGASYASFDFTVSDGAASSSPVNVLSVDVNSLNDAPQGNSKTVTTLEDSAYTFAAVDFGFSDPNDSPANNLQAVEVTTLPGAGTLTDNGVAVSAGQFVSVADIAGGKLVFAPAANANGSGYASFAFQVQDDGGTAGGGADTDPTPRTMTIDVTPVNDAPQGVSNAVTTLEDTAHTFTVADFGFGDPNDVPADALAAVEITTLPGAGSLTDNGAAVAAGQFVSVADINGGRLRFSPAANANGAGYASFTFRVQDNGGIANSGVDLDPTPRTMTIDVTAVNDAPVIGNDTLTIGPGGSVILSSANLSATDVDNPAASLAFTVTNVLDGRFELVATPGVAVTNFTQGAIAGGQVRFVHDGSANAPAFDLAVSDGTLNAGPTAATIVFSVPGGPIIAPPGPTPPPPTSNPGNTPLAPPPPAQPAKPVQPAVAQVVTLSGGLPMAPEPVGTELYEPVRGANPSLRVDAKLPRSNLNPAPLLRPVTQTLLIEGTDPQSMEFGPLTKVDWSAQTAFPSADRNPSEHDQIQVIMESVRMGGIALSVGVVWWASRVTGLIGSLLASMPAWRQLDPLPIIGRDEEEDRWDETEDSEADADELAISMVLEGPRSRDAVGAQ